MINRPPPGSGLDNQKWLSGLDAGSGHIWLESQKWLYSGLAGAGSGQRRSTGTGDGSGVRVSVAVLVAVAVWVAVRLGIWLAAALVTPGSAVAVGKNKPLAMALFSIGRLFSAGTPAMVVGGSGSVVVVAKGVGFAAKAVTAGRDAASGSAQTHPTPNRIVHNNPSTFHDDDCRIK